MAENKDDKKEIKTKAISLGQANQFDPNAPQAEIFITQAMLNARQEAIGITRKYAGPVSDEKLETLSDEMDSEEKNISQVPPTECEEPSEYEKIN